MLVVLDKETEGQAETIYLALQQLPDKQDEPLYIFNIDTFRYDFVKPDFALACDGYIEVFQGEGEHWSFVEPTGDNDVARTTEKERISDLCSDGLYYFASNALFRHYFEQMKNRNLYVKNELYVAPMYNLLLADGKVVKYDLIAPDAIDFCGTPSEYEALLAHGLKRTTA